MSTVDLSGLVWRKGSRSGTHSNGNCVEVAYTEAAWRKSSRSGTHSNDACVEVVFVGPAVALRDSKHPAVSLVVPAQGFATFVGTCCQPR